MIGGAVLGALLAVVATLRMKSQENHKNEKKTFLSRNKKAKMAVLHETHRNPNIDFTQ